MKTQSDFDNFNVIWLKFRQNSNYSLVFLKAEPYVTSPIKEDVYVVLLRKVSCDILLFALSFL